MFTDPSTGAINYVCKIPYCRPISAEFGVRASAETSFKRDRSVATDGTVFCTHCSKFVSKRTFDRHSILSGRHYRPVAKDTVSCNSSQSESDDDIMREFPLRESHVSDSRLHHTLLMDSGGDDDKYEEDELSDVGGSLNMEADVPGSLQFEDLDTSGSVSETEEPTGTVVWDDITTEDVAHDTEQPKHKNVSETQCLVQAGQIVTWILTTILSLQRQHFISNVCTEKLLLLVSQILSLLSPVSRLCLAVLQIFPKTMYSTWKYLQIDRDNFTKYIVCPNCNCLHLYDSVIRIVDGTYIASKCDNKVFSCRVVGSSSRKKGKFKCNGNLVKSVQLKGGKTVLYPLKFYCYRGLIDNLQQCLSKPQFLEKCNQWRYRKVPQHFYADVFDGEIWKNFVEFNGSDFLTQPYHFGFMLNVDWFQPHDRRRDISVGALYMVFMNLPREERFRSENAMLIGLIPALSKEPESLNSFLEPLVNELKALWNGVLMNVLGYSTPVLVKAALMCAAADIPAARKLCGFLGHGAIQGCSFCCKPQRVNGEASCGLPKLEKWPLRTRENHLKWAKKSLSALCLTDLRETEKYSGYRFTSLLKLEYFEPSKMTVVDPMHNLFLGTAKKMFSHWIDAEIIDKRGLDEISKRIKSLQISSDIGSIPNNIATNYGQMTAKEWKNWVLVYSVFCLKDILPMTHLRVWQTFVLACRHLCQACISVHNVSVASMLLVNFLKRVQEMYGNKFVTPNMHLHCHLQESIRNYGSLYGFWLFSFERYNGILADFPTNKRCIETQLMRKFLMFSVLDGSSLPNEYHVMFDKVCQPAHSNVMISSPEVTQAHSQSIHEVPSNVWSDLSMVSFKDTGYTIHTLSKKCLLDLLKAYEYIYQKTFSTCMLSSFFHRYDTIKYGSITLGSESNKRSDANNIVHASWTDDNTEMSMSTLRPARVKYFLRHPFEPSPGDIIDHVFAYVEWFKPSLESFGYVSPVSVWSAKCQNDGPASFLPVQRIHGKGAWHMEFMSSQRFIVTVPVAKQSYM